MEEEPKVQDKETIIKEIKQFVKDKGGNYPDYYIGITNDPERRLNENNISESREINEHRNDGIYTDDMPYEKWECKDRDTAVEIERDFQDLGMRKYNALSFGVEESRYVYCFKLDKGNIRRLMNENLIYEKADTDVKDQIESKLKIRFLPR